MFFRNKQLFVPLSLIHILLHAVETGTITLIGATTENPSFEVIRPLLSRCQVYLLKAMEVKDLEELMKRALTEDDIPVSYTHLDVYKRQVYVPYSRNSGIRAVSYTHLRCV